MGSIIFIKKKRTGPTTIKYGLLYNNNQQP